MIKLSKFSGIKGCFKFSLFLAFFLFVLIFHVSAVDKSKMLYFSAQNISLKDLFSQVEKQTGLVVIYSNDELDVTRQVKLQSAGYRLEDLLDLALLKTNLVYRISEKYIVIKVPISNPSIRTISGIVLDDQKEPLMGATILVKGTNIGTIADADGNFQLSIPVEMKNAVLVASFVGMSSVQKNPVPNQQRVTFSLLPSTTTIDEVLVVGAYGTSQKRSDLVSSAYQINEKQLESLPVARIDNILDGLIPGLQVTPNTDAASSTKQRFDLRIRGEGSMSASSEPLWIIDGIPYFTGDKTNLIAGVNTSVSPLSYINQDDIESFTVLKDAAATSIYGANGANGVVLVTTKKGKASKMVVSLSQRNGISYINQSTKFKVLNAKQYMNLAKEAYLNAGKDMSVFPFQDNVLNAYSSTSTDWSDVYYDNGFTNETNLTLRGGTELAKYYVSGSYFKNKSTVIGNEQDRYSTRVNLNLQMSKKLTLGINTAASYNVNTAFNPGNDYYDILPIYSVYNADGTYRLYNQTVSGMDTNGGLIWSKTRFLNSVAERDQNDNYQRTMMLNNNIMLEYNILKGLAYTAQIGTDYQSVNEYIYEARSNWSGMDLTTGEKIGYATKNNASIMNFTGIQRLNYNKVIEKSSLGGLLGMEVNSKTNNNLGASGSGFVNDLVKEISYAAETSSTGSRSESRALSYFGQATYSYDERYFFNVNSRRDGTSGFGSDSKWSNFGSVGVSWNFNKEKFYPFKFIDIFKLKATYGTNGNSRIGTLEAMGLYSYNESDNYMGSVGSSLSGSPNPSLSWETARMTNLGLRLRFFKRVDLEIEGYWKNTINLISNLDVSRTTGDTRVYRNSGEILNKGIEVNLDINVIDRKDVNWTISLNGAHNENKLIDLYNGIEKVMGNYIWREGYDLNTLYLIRWAGVDPRDGAPLWYDANNNLTRTYSADNRVPWKSSSPIMTGGIINSFKYKNLTFSSQMSYVLGGYAFSTFGRNVSSDGYLIMSQNQSVNQLDRWQEPGDVALTPKLVWGSSSKSVMNSTRYVYKTTYLKVKNIALSYNLPASIYQSLGINTCRVSLIGDNLAIWTPYDKKNRNSYKQSISGYPMETTFSVGLDLSF